jgi:hypothetical protein
VTGDGDMNANVFEEAVDALKAGSAMSNGVVGRTRRFARTAVVET